MGKKWHYAHSLKDTRAVCGKEFSVGFDETEDEQNLQIKHSEKCQHCLVALKRIRTKRRSNYD